MTRSLDRSSHAFKTFVKKSYFHFFFRYGKVVWTKLVENDVGSGYTALIFLSNRKFMQGIMDAINGKSYASNYEPILGR